MKDTEFYLLDPIAETINTKFEKLLNAGEFDGIKRKMKEAIGKLPDTYSLNFNIELSVFDRDKEHSIELLQTGLTTGEGEPYQISSDTATQKYLVDGETCLVPDEFYPNCWGQWMLKIKYNQCDNCEYELGKQVKYLLDTDVCPYCGKGKVTINNPVCDNCGYEVEKNKVVWG